MLDSEGKVRTWNSGAEKLKGWSAEEVLGRSFELFYPREQVAAGRPRHQLARALEQRRCLDDGWRVRKDGSRFWGTGWITALFDDGERLVGFAKITRDLTEQRRLQEQLRQSQKMEAIGQLAAGVAHDFNNLLSIVAGYTEVLHDALPEDSPLRDPVLQIRGAGERAAALTQQLLTLGRRSESEPRLLDLAQAVGDLRGLLLPAVGEKVRLTVVAESGLAPVRIDPGHFAQVLLNLALNARDAMPHGGRLAIELDEVEVDAAEIASRPELPAGRYVRVAVSDSGLGIPPDARTRLFEPFFTTKQSGRGSGLGLSMVWGIVRQAGGHVEVYSEVGVGTVFKVYLPTAGGGAAEPVPQRADALPGRGETILLVEDEPALRTLGQVALTAFGYRVLAAGSAPQALELFEREGGAVDLVVTDLVLAEGGGRELAEELARRSAGIRVLFVSGFSSEVAARNGLIAGSAVEYLPKPYSTSRLARRIRALLDRP